MVDVAVLASGRGSNLQALCQAQADHRLGPARVRLVLSDQEDARALQIARDEGIEALHIDPAGLDREAYDARVVAALDERGIDLVVLAGFLRILSPRFVQAYRHRIINIHPALLPSFPGLDGPRQALDHGVRVTGATTHFVDEEVDHGPIILQSVVPVLPDDTDEVLGERILATEHELLVESVRLFVEGRLSVSGRKVEIKGERSYPRTPLFVPEVAT